MAAGQNVVAAEPEVVAAAEVIDLPEHGRLVSAHLPGSVWQVVVAEGAVVAEGEKMIILESMKMETAICAPCAGKVGRILVAAGRTVEAGQGLVVMIEVSEKVKQVG